MADVKLLKISRMIQNDHLRWRVAAASFLHASANVQAYAGLTNKDPYKYAEYTLMHPGEVDTSMLAFVAADPAVLAAATLGGPLNEVTTTDEVKDADIERVVAARWQIVSNKYASHEPVA
jgi:hypothetical protein